MIFIENKYTKYYRSLIEKAMNRGLHTRYKAKKILGYVERHHVVPKSLGGPNTNNNLVFLTAKEHFVAHRLLVKITDGKNRVKMIYALHKMMSISSFQQRHRISSKKFEEIRSLIMSTSGEDHYNRGKKRTEEWKNDRREMYLGEKNPNFGNTGVKNPLFNKPSMKKKGNAGKNNPMFGKSQKESSKKLLSESALARPKVSCLCCRLVSDVSNFNRWHGDKCKSKYPIML
jgi:hypothetical protein